MIWDSIEATAYQAKERIGSEMLAFFGDNERHGKPHQHNIHVVRCGVYCRTDVYEKPMGRAW